MKGGGAPRLVGKIIEVPTIHRDGSRLITEFSLGMWSSPETGLPSGFAAIIRDVGQRKISESRLAEQIAAIEATNEGISISDTDGIQHYMNEAFLRLFGLPSNTTNFPWSRLIAAHERETPTAASVGQLADGSSWSGEVVGLKADGSLLDLELSLTRRDKSVVRVVRDISSRREALRELARLREQVLVAQRLEAVGQLASGLAHDFGNLIAAISGSAALIGLSAESDSRRHAARIETASRAAAALVGKMLLMGKRTSHYQAYDAREIARDVGDLLRVSLSHGQRLVLEFDAEPVTANLDRTELMQVLLNLGLNARDALQDRSDSRIVLGVRSLDEAPNDACVIVGAIPAGPLAHFYVSDNGCGIAPEELSEIFQPFYSRKAESGNGLGLTMVAGITVAVGGGIAVRSLPGEGTRFDVYWPLDPRLETHSDIGVAPIFTHPPIGSALTGLTILLVDDEPTVIATFSEMFERIGVEVGSCSDPGDALAAIADDPDAWDLLVTDFDMPKMDGAALATAARALRPDLPILLLTALPDVASERPGACDLFDAISGKFISLSELEGAALAALSHRRSKVS